MYLARIQNIIVYGQQAQEGEEQSHGGEEMPEIVIVVERPKSKIKHKGLVFWSKDPNPYFVNNTNKIVKMVKFCK